MTANRISVNANVSAAAPVCVSVRMVRRSSKIKKRISIWINVLAADVVSIGACPMDAVKPPADGSSMEALNKKMAEYAWAILHGRPHFHISLIVDVSPYCDCHAENDAPVVPNIGMLASFDPVALDQACADLVNAAPIMANSLLDDHLKADPEGCQGHDHFHNLTPESEWKTCLAHAEKLGMGTRAYELVTVK